MIPTKLYILNISYGKKTILKPIHLKFLEEANKVSYVVNNFYWNSGTVLSEFYLHHRELEDIDFFIENNEVNLGVIKSFIANFAKKTKSKKLLISIILV